jgi:hypothetical protein
MRIAAFTLTLLMASPALANPVCTQSVSLNAREVAPCTGILWSPDRTRQCLKCEQERLPACHAQRQRDNEVCSANIDDLRARLLQQPGAAPPSSKAAIWAAGGVVVGALIGVFIAKTL